MFVARPIFAKGGEDDSAHVPEWVPQLVGGGRADVYPVDGAPAAELRLDRAAVTSGYAERKHAYEFASCITGNPEPLRSSAAPAPPMLADGAQLQKMLGKIRSGIATLRRARPTKSQRVELGVVDPLAIGDDDVERKRPALFPFQKPSASASLDDWFNRLSAGGSYSTASLSGAVPLGPAIVRAAGKVLEMLASRGVPTQRAAWYIRIAVLNECVKQVRPDRPPPSPRIFWTKQLCNLLKVELEGIRARKTSALGSMERLLFWNYVLDLARWQADEALLDDNAWLARICSALRAEATAATTLNSVSAKIVVLAVQRFLPDILLSRQLRNGLRDALMPVAAQVLGAAHAALHGGTTPRSRAHSRTSQTLSVRETGSQAAFIKATLKLAALLGNIGPEDVAMRRLLTYQPKHLFTAEAAIEKAFELVSSKKSHVTTARLDSVEKSSSIRGRSDKLLWDTAADQLSPLDVTATLERFPASGNAHVLRSIMRSAFAKIGAERAAVEHICKWALGARSLDTAHVVATAAAAIEILTQTARKSMPSAGKSDSRGKLARESATSKKATTTNDPKSQSDSKSPPLFHREIWQFLKELAEDDDDEEREEDQRAAALIARLCRVGVFSLTAFVRDVARIPSNPPGGPGRLVRYVHLLPEPHERQSADARRALLRRYGLLPSADEQAKDTASLERILGLIRSGNELGSIREGHKLRLEGNPATQLSIAASIVQEVTEAQLKAPDKVAVCLRPIVSFLRAAGHGALAVDFLLDCLGRLLAVATQANASRSQGVCAGINVAIECLPHLAPLLAATNQLTTAIGMLGRGWNTALSNSAQQRIRLSAERAALMLGKYFCSCAPLEHEQWKNLVTGAFPLASFASMKQLFCGLLAGAQLTYMEKLQALSSAQMFLSKSAQLVRGSVTDKQWMGQGVDSIFSGKKATWRQALVERMTANDVERIYKELMCVNHVLDGVIIPVLRVSATLMTLPDNGYRNLIENITNILCSTWMQTLGDEMRPYSFIEVVAFLLVGSMADYTGAREALARVTELPWMRQLISLHAGKGFFERMLRLVSENLPPEMFDEVTVTREVCNTIVMLCGKDAGIEASGIVSGIGMKPASVTQMLFCGALTLGRVRGTDADFASKAAEVVGACNSNAETSVLTRMLLRCYDDEDLRAGAANDIAVCATHAMAESLKFFVTGITAETRENNFVNQQRASAWLGADEARRAMLAVAAGHLREGDVKHLTSLLVAQIEKLSTRMLEAAAARCIPRDASPTGRRTATAVDARARLVLGLTRAAPAKIDAKSVARCAARLLAATVYLLNDCTIDTLIELVRVSVFLATASKTDDTLSAEVRMLTAEARPLLESRQWHALQLAMGDAARASALHSKVVARGHSGEPVDNWYLLEGYGRGEDEDAAVPPAAFVQQADPAPNTPPPQSVRLKRTYSTFACLVR